MMLDTTLTTTTITKTFFSNQHMSNKEDVPNANAINSELKNVNENCTWLGVKTLGKLVIGEFAPCYEKDFRGKKNSF